MGRPPKLTEVFLREGGGDPLPLVRELIQDLEVLSDAFQERRYGSHVGHHLVTSEQLAFWSRKSAEDLKKFLANSHLMTRNWGERHEPHYAAKWFRQALTPFFRHGRPLGMDDPDDPIPPHGEESSAYDDVNDGPDWDAELRKMLVKIVEDYRRVYDMLGGG